MEACALISPSFLLTLTQVKWNRWSGACKWSRTYVSLESWVLCTTRQMPIVYFVCVMLSQYFCRAAILATRLEGLVPRGDARWPAVQQRCNDVQVTQLAATLLAEIARAERERGEGDLSLVPCCFSNRTRASLSQCCRDCRWRSPCRQRAVFWLAA